MADNIQKRKKVKSQSTPKVQFKHKGNPKTPKEFVDLVWAQNERLEDIKSEEITTNLLDLSIVQNQLYSETLIKFKNLRDLRLENCSLSNFYPEVETIEKLRILSLKNNRLESIQTVYQCLELETCVLDGNLFTEIPKQILESAKNLRELSIAKNKLTGIHPDLFEQWQGLVYLDISANKFKEIPQFWLKCNQLTHFRAILNNIEDIHTDLYNFAVNLKLLVLDQNPISQLSNSIKNLKDLEVLSLSYTQITQIPKPAVFLQKIHLLNVENTPLKEPPLFCAMRGLKSMRSYYTSDQKEMDDKDSKYAKKFKQKETIIKSITSVNNQKERANKLKQQKLPILEEENEEEEKEFEDEATRKAAQYTEKIMEEDFLWDVINMLHKNRDLRLEQSYDQIRESVMKLEPDLLYDVIAECLLSKVQSDEITELPEFAKGMKVIKQMKREKANTSYTGVKHSHQNVEKFVANLSKVINHNQINVQLKIK